MSLFHPLLETLLRVIAGLGSSVPFAFPPLLRVTAESLGSSLWFWTIWTGVATNTRTVPALGTSAML